MRNPWAVEKYKGPWRDDDPNWTPAKIAAVGGLTKADDGKFWMPYKTYIDLFYSTNIAFFEKWKHSTHELKLGSNQR